MMDPALLNLDPKALTHVIATLLTTLVGLAWKKYAEARPKVIAYLVHSGGAVVVPGQHIPNPALPPPTSGALIEAPAIEIPATVWQPPVTVHTHALVLRNNGGKSAMNVRLGHTQMHPFSIYPHTNFSVNNGEILIPVLAPKEQLTITYVYGPPTTVHDIHTYKKSDEALVKDVRYIPAPVLPKPALIFISAVFFLGCITAMSYLLRWLWTILIVTG